ncbi:hypothetical protein CAP35_02355 [Chitinophagaceae bacterium IBVUCB1]|nr:hypothetical protein CAP35_02355 [Chitinophagaceae bacterium IBVUCB1]
MKNTIKAIILIVLSICGNKAYSQLNADFTASVTNGCAPLVVSFFDNSSGSPTSYSWNMGGTPSTLKNPSRTFTSPGTYTVSLTIYKGSSSDVETKTNYITVHPAPVVNFSATPLTGCAPLTVSFTDASTAGGTGSNTYSWYMGASVGTRTGPTPTATFSTPGSQSITLTVTNSFGCSTTHTKPNYITVLPRPTGNFTASPIDFCSSPAVTTFTGTATGNGPFAYRWIYGDGSPDGTGISSGHTYVAPPNSWTPRMVVTDVNGCTDSVSRSAYINIHYPTASISSANSVCQGSSISFTSTVTPGGGTYSWNFGDGLGTSGAANPSYTYSTSGTFTVTLIYTFRGCSVTAQKTVIVHPKPVADFTYNPDSLCPAPVTTQFVANGSYSSYLWNFGVVPLTTSTAVSPSHTYIANGLYSPTLIVSTANGCRDTITKTNYVEIYDLQAGASADKDKGCVPLTVTFSASAITNTPGPLPAPYPYGIKSYSWNFNDGSSLNTQASPTYTFIDTGVFNVTVTITTNNGCTKTATVQIKVGPKPDAAFGVSPPRICMNNLINITDSSTGKIDTWLWDFLDSNYAVVQGYTGKSPGIKYKGLPGTFTIRQIVSYYGCADTAYKMYYITIDSPKAVFNKEISCDTLHKVNFKYEAIGATSHVWLFGDPLNTTSTALNPGFVYPNAGTYTARLATHNSRSGCRDTMEQQIVLTNRTMTLSVNDTTICPGDSIRFTSILTGRPYHIYSWYINDALVADSAVNFTRKFTVPGFHKIKVIITDALLCKDSIVRNNYIFVSKPTAAFSGTPTDGCIPMTVSFNNSSTVIPGPGSTITDKVWNFGVGANVPITPNTTSFTYTSRGLYDVKLMVKDINGCTDTLTRTAYINARKPIAQFSVKDTACIDELLTFTNSSVNALTAVWDFGDGGTSNNLVPTYRYKAKGNYTVRLIVTDAIGCKDTITIPNAVNIVKPDPSFTISDSVAVCPPLLVNFTNTTPNASTYLWRTGLSTSNSFNTNEFYTAKNKYDVTLITTNKFGCADSITKSVRILGYAGAFSYTPLNGCKPLDVNFTTITTNIAGMTWDFDDGYVVKSLTGTISHRYDIPGAYVPRIIYEDAKGCKTSSDGEDTIKVDAVEADFYATSPCQYSTVTFVDTSKSYFSSVNGWKWTFNDNTTSGLKKPTKFYGPAGKYPIKLWVQNQRGCIDSINKEIEIHPLPVISAGADTTICLKDTATLTASGGLTYIWNTTPYLSCLDCPSPLAYPAEAFRFVVTGKDANGCTNKDSVWVRLKTKVVAISGPDEDICEKDAVTLTISGAKTYKWTPPTGLDNDGSAAPVASPSITTKYTVISYEGSCIPDTDFVNVTVHPLPEVTATGSAKIIAGNSTPISATGKLIDRFKWVPAESLSCSDCPDPTASPSKTTEYTIHVFTDFGCVDSDKVTITVLCDKSQLFIPNTFTPNGDGQNDIFYPRGNGLDKLKSFRIYNRWGETVFERSNIALNDQYSGWDGNFRGAQLPPDVFVYIVEAYCDNGDVMTIKGDITLVR